ncbi:MAG: social motility and stimulation tgl protein [Myxococcaceae bacterium]
MFTFDERIRGLPVSRESVQVLYQSLNSPQLGIPGKQAGPAQAYIAGFQGPNGSALFIYLYLAESQDCAVYVCDKRNMGPDEFAAEENEALGFVESMGFMMDNLNFTNIAPEQQDELMKTLPLFQRDVRSAGAAASTPKAQEAKKSPAVLLGRILSSF